MTDSALLVALQENLECTLPKGALLKPKGAARAQPKGAAQTQNQRATQAQT